MITLNFLPSSYYPEYFKSQLGLGTPEELPFAVALDSLMQRYLTSRMMNLSDSYRCIPDLKLIRSYLSQLGFQLEGLTGEQLKSLYQVQPELFRTKGTLHAIDVLAEHHFGKYESFKGLPFQQSRAVKSHLENLRIFEADHHHHWITYQVLKPDHEGLIQSFMNNSKLFLPSHIKIHLVLLVLKEEKIEASPVPHFTIEQPTRLFKRRI